MKLLFYEVACIYTSLRVQLLGFFWAALKVLPEFRRGATVAKYLLRSERRLLRGGS